MAILRTLSYAALLAFTGLGVASCLNPPDYSDTPEISFSKIETKRIEKREGTYDTISITVSFKDGDGDLGLSNEDTDPPFNEVNIINGDTVPNKNYNNYFITPQIRDENGNFNDLDLGGFNYNSRYPRLEPDTQGDRKAPLRGDLTFGLIFGQNSFAPNTSVRFKVYITDRALHQSNEITTSPILIK